MIRLPERQQASLLTRLPPHLHHAGEPTAWTRMTRPGRHLHSFLEGAAFGPDNALYLADVPHGRIFKLKSETLEWSIAFAYAGEPHGLAFLPDGALVIADYRLGLLRIALGDHEPEPLCTDYQGENFRGLSDLVVDPDGAIWFTDSGRTSLSDPTGRLFRLDSDNTLRCILDTIAYPNGVAITADGKHVLVAATRANAVWRLLRDPPGTGRPMAGLFCQLSGGLGPDGVAVAPSGEIAVAHAQAGRVWLFDALGDPIALVTTPGGMWTTSVRFGGPDGRTLFIVDAEAGAVLTHRLE